MKPLTPRQREIVALLVEGWTRKEIALCLGLSRKTVDVHLQLAKRRWQAQTVAHLAAFYVLHLRLEEIREQGVVCPGCGARRQRGRACCPNRVREIIDGVNAQPPGWAVRRELLRPAGQAGRGGAGP